VDGVLVGRGAQGDPWIFQSKDMVKQALRCGEDLFLPDCSISMAERFAVVVEHSEHFERLFGRSRFMAMRKHLTWYCRNFRGAAEMRAKMTRVNSADEVRQRLQEFARATSDVAAMAARQIANQQSGGIEEHVSL
jgi:tRNA-dihydrouridine synthase